MKPQYILMLLVLLVGRVWADSAYIPPESPQAAITRTANGQAMDYRTAGPNQPSTTHFNGGTWSRTADGLTIFTPDRPHFNQAQRPTAGAGGTGGTATKRNPVTMTGRYGEKATGTITTQTQLPQNSTLAKIGGAYMGTAAAGSVLNSPHAQNAAKQLAQGNYAEAALSAAASFDIFGIGQGINGLADAFKNAQNKKSEKFSAAAEAAAAEAARQYNPAEKTATVIYDSQKVDKWQNWRKGLVKIIQGEAHFVGNNGGVYTWVQNGQVVYRLTEAEVWAPATIHIENTEDLYKHTPTFQDLMLTELEMQNVATQHLQELLNQSRLTNEAIRDLANALWSGGQLGPGNTQTAVIGGDSANTFLSAPYTPQGSQTAQQTEFVIHVDGTVSTNTISRPDLAAHTSQAPTRAPIQSPSSTTQAPNPAKENPKAETPDVCKANPGSIMCADLGSADYEDVVLPEKKMDFDFEPADIFSTDGTCPAPKTVNLFGKTYEITYQPICDFAGFIRPVIILLGMYFSMQMAWAAVKEL